MKVAIVDYGAGNLPSVERALRNLGAETERATEPQQVAAAKAIVLPGVGHFSAFVNGLRERNLTSSLREAYDSGVPMLGICLGLQAMFASSEEAPGARASAFSRRKFALCRRTSSLRTSVGISCAARKPACCLRGIPEDAYFYFAHSYAAPAAAESTVAACDHGFPFAAVIEQRRLAAVQFHPEKSGETGARVLRNFLESAQ